MVKQRGLSFALKTFIFSLALVFFAANGYSEKIVIAYTGNTYASLYPCGTCPASVGGGVARRATVLNESAKEANLILVDSGNFTGSGIFDSKSVSPKQDQKRTLFYYKAMSQMGYEVVAVGENEFSFGSDFLSNSAKKSSFTSAPKSITFLCNFALSSLTPREESFSFSNAATPATCGAAIEVPSKEP